MAQIEFEDIRGMLSNAAIVDELIQYMSTDELDEFADHLVSAFDLDYNEDEEEEDQVIADALELFDEYDTDIINVSDFDLTFNGTKIDNITLEDGEIFFYAGDPSDDEGDWEELVIDDNNKHQLLQEIMELM